MTIGGKLIFLLIAMLLIGCAGISRTLISLDGSRTDDLTVVALITEDQNFPVLLRGLDGMAVKSMRIPNPYGRYAYVMGAGKHVLWLKSAPYPHPLIPQRLYCYTMSAELHPGVSYYLKEDVGKKQALLLREDSGETVSTGELVDEPWVFQRDCRW